MFISQKPKKHDLYLVVQGRREPKQAQIEPVSM